MDFSKSLKEQVRNLPPSYFLLVMATGIIALASDLFKYSTVSDFFFWSANIFYVILIFLYGVRLFFFFPKVKNQLGSHAMGAGFLTFVAASAVVGLCYSEIEQLFAIAKIFLIVAFVGWLILLYGFLLKTTLSSMNPPIKKISGNWLLTAVSTHALAFLTAILNPHFSYKKEMLFVSLCAWLLGILLYLVFVTIILYRMNFFPIKAEKISPSFWLDAGAAAAGSIAGAAIIGTMKNIQVFQELIPFIQLINLFLWMAATWWLILLFFQEVWRHVKTGFNYSPGYWSLVFPLGIYCVASSKMSGLFKINFLSDLSQVVLYLVWGLWLLVFLFMVFSILKKEQHEG